MSGEARIQPKRKPASAASEKQMAHAAKSRKRVSVVLPDGSKVSGYLVGADNYHWVLLSADGHTHLVHKTAPAVTIEKMSIENDPDAASIASSIEGYRSSVLVDYFKHNDDDAEGR